LSIETIHQTLVKLGFTETEAKVYVQLAKEGSQGSRDIAKGLNLNTRQIYNNLKKMQVKGFIENVNKCQNTFSAVPFEKVLDMLIKEDLEKAKYVMKNMRELLVSWSSMTDKDY
jgi:sugar-specific transcriptional regulator TrmB